MPWKKGESGNPGGRPRLMQGIRRKAQNASEEMLEILLSVARNSDKGSERTSAAAKVLQIAGVPMTADEGQAQTPEKPQTTSSPDALLAAVTQREGNA